MKVFDLSCSLRMDGKLQRQAGYSKAKPTKPFQFQSSLTSDQAITTSRLSIRFHLLPFQQLFRQSQNAVLSFTLWKISSKAEITIYLKRCRVLELVCRTQYEGEEVIQRKVTSQASLLNTLIYNQVEAVIDFPLQVALGENLKCSTVVGDRDKPEKSFKGLIKGIFIILENTTTNEGGSISIKPDDRVVVPTVSHPVEMTEFSMLPQPFTCSKPPHFIPQLPAGPKFLVCHDMMGGYVEDINDYSTTAGKTNYRFHHFGITDIFIYFSHYNFTIPPKGWIETCHNNGTLCLGTFIIEREIDYVKKETADYLIYLARHHGFDGYLINIEYSVNSVEKFKTWLQYLVVELHNRLPGSKVIWYDSIISSGKLQWQSELNDSNAEFFQLCDYFFTDYKWNVDKLQRCHDYAEKLGRTADVFVGNDIWGRGTFGGGKFQTYRGVQEISKRKMSVALFAPAYTYQDQGSKNLELFRAADDGLFFGKKFTAVKASDNGWSITKQGGNGWKKQGDQWVASWDWCIREWTIPIKPDLRNTETKVTFTGEVKGTPPKTQDPYSITMQTLIEGGFVVGRKSSGQGSSVFTPAPPHWQQITLNSNFGQLGNTASLVDSIVITETGKDLEKWAGHFGTRFKNEQLLLSSYVQEMDLSAMVRKKGVGVLPYHSYFNAGQGASMFWKGVAQPPSTKSQIKGYDSLKDYDLPYQDKSAKPEYNGGDVQSTVSFQNAWIGGTSIQIRCSKNDGLFGMYKLLNLKISGDKGLSVTLKVKQSAEHHKYTLLALVNKSEWRNTPGFVKRLQTDDWYQVSFNLEPQAGILTSITLQLELACQDKIYLGEMLVTTRADPVIKTPVIKYSALARQSPLKHETTSKYIDVALCNQSYDEAVPVPTIPNSFVTLTKCLLLFINGQARGSISINQKFSYVQSLKLQSLADVLIEIVHIDRNGNFAKVFESKPTTLNALEYEWMQV